MGISELKGEVILPMKAINHERPVPNPKVFMCWFRIRGSESDLRIDDQNAAPDLPVRVKTIIKKTARPLPGIVR